MANVRNYEEYRAEVLDTLGATMEDLRNEPSFRAKVLETLGVEFTDEDTRNFERYRLKALEGLKNGGGSGGGGSSDFSTAEVTLVNNAPDSVSFNLALAMAMSQGGVSATVGGISSDVIGLGMVVNAVLYNGSAIIETQGINPLISGNIESLGDHMYLVTGDCTITIS